MTLEPLSWAAEAGHNSEKEEVKATRGLQKGCHSIESLRILRIEFWRELGSRDSEKVGAFPKSHSRLASGECICVLTARGHAPVSAHRLCFPTVAPHQLCLL